MRPNEQLTGKIKSVTPGEMLNRLSPLSAFGKVVLESDAANVSRVGLERVWARCST